MMDKYTVDLDQVLNDFEYSELTDNHQYENIKNNIKNNDENCYIQNNKNCTTNTTSSSSNNSIRKHSINNVFHSLNEYVNTSVAPAAEVTQSQITYSIPVNEPVQIDLPQKFVDFYGKNRVDTSVISAVKEEEKSFDLPKLEEKPVEISDLQEKSIDIPKLEESALEILPKLEEKPLENRKLEEIPVEILELDEESVVDTTEDLIGEPCDESKNLPVLNVDNSCKAIESISSIQYNEIPAMVKESITDKTEEEQPEEIIDDSLKRIPNNFDKIEEVKEQLEIIDVDEVVETNPKIGFSDDIDLDERELDQYLEELELEYESQETAEEKDDEDDGELEKSAEKCDKIDNVVAETMMCSVEEIHARPNNLPLPKLDDEDGSNVIDLIGNPGSTPYNNVYIDKELPPQQQQQQENKVDSDIESSSISPTFSDASIETASSCTQSTDTVNDDVETINTMPSNSEVVLEAVEQKPPEEKEEVKPSTEDEPSRGEPIESTNETADESSSAAASGAPNPPPPPPTTTTTTNENREVAGTSTTDWLGRQAPLWIPDSDAISCLHCDTKFTVIKRRHHCRACGLVLCSKCCNLKYNLEYLDDIARVCNKCYDILELRQNNNSGSSGGENEDGSKLQPNPNNPLEYCSTIPPHQQVGAGASSNPPSVLVPVGVLKRKGRSGKSRSNKSVMFCDGIRPGSDLTNLDIDFTYKGNPKRESTDLEKRKDDEEVASSVSGAGERRNTPAIVAETKSFIPISGEDSLPPTIVINKTDVTYVECRNGTEIIETVKNQSVAFCIQLNLLVHLKIVNMDCCINKQAWCFTTEGLINVGQDEIVILLELLDNENSIPKDIFLHINSIYMEAVKGNSIKEMGLSLHTTTNFLGSKNHAGFLFIRPTFQCLQNIEKPKEPYLIGILIHKWETPWAKLFPLRLILRLGAEYRYYPTPIISNRFRDSVFVEIGHTIINLLADFRNFSYTLPQIRGLTIHMEDKNTTVTIPMNRYDQVMKSMNNSSDNILAFGGNFSMQADSHLVCIQDTQNNENSYTTHAINIHNKPRKVTGASFIVFSGALKSSSGLTAKSSIVEDGLMIQISSEHMVQIREDLRNMKNHTIQCGCINAASDESVVILWGDSDVNFNINVISPIDNQSMNGIPSIRVHNGKDHVCHSGKRLIRWTEVFILQNEDELRHNQDPVDISKISESIAKATCNALVKYLDLLASNNFYKIGIRTTLHIENVSYSAGSNNLKLPPIYMKSLDNELIPVLHRITSNNFTDNAIVLELIFRILHK